MLLMWPTLRTNKYIEVKRELLGRVDRYRPSATEAIPLVALERHSHSQNSAIDLFQTFPLGWQYRLRLMSLPTC